ncbi:MAG: acyltransferase family protein [Rhizomicrobium sp.]
MVLLPIFFYSDATAFPGWAAVVPTLGTGLILGSGPSVWLNRVVLSWKPVVYVGLISYPLYLWHWPLLSIAQIETLDQASTMLRFGMVLLSFVLAAATYTYVERPVRRSAMSTCPILLLVGCVAALGVAGLAAEPLRSRLQPPNGMLGADQLRWDYLNNQPCTSKFEPADGPPWLTCVANSAAPSILVLGDSHANHLYPGLVSQEALASRGVVSFGAGGPMFGVYSVGVGSTPEQIRAAIRQKAWQDEILLHVSAKMPSVRYVILSSRWPSFTASGAFADHFTGRPEPRFYFSIDPSGQRLSQEALFSQGLELTISVLEKQNIAVILFLDTPFPSYDVRRCMDRPYFKARETCSVDRNEMRTARASFTKVVERLRPRHPHLLVYDPFPVFCNAKSCSFVSKTDVFLRDDEHLSVAGSRAVAAHFAAWASAAIPDLLRGQGGGRRGPDLR